MNWMELQGQLSPDLDLRQVEAHSLHLSVDSDGRLLMEAVYKVDEKGRRFMFKDSGGRIATEHVVLFVDELQIKVHK